HMLVGSSHQDLLLGDSSEEIRAVLVDVIRDPQTGKRKMRSTDTANAKRLYIQMENGIEKVL
ncbi:MAG TPA: hypothetical protein PLN25_10230, partial [Deltaproteobacteria bacterium]|nr:hypothetical protein [Deltaproteobacteria bacterium]HQB38923.1 hypothetical protein [Deltaproteobacteria bacterium]